MTQDVGPPLASDASVCMSSRVLSERPSEPRRASARSHRGLRNELAYPSTAQWAFLTSTPQHLDCRHHRRPVPPSRPATARGSAAVDCTDLPKRPATSRGLKSKSILQQQKELLTPRGATTAIREAMKRERDQEQYVDPLIGRSVEPRRQPTPRECSKMKAGKIETSTTALLSRPRVITTATMNATERLRLRAFQARANGEYDRAIKFYKELSIARPNEVDAHFHLAVCLERTGQLGPALAAYKQVQKLSRGRHPFAYSNMGNLCMRSDQMTKAIDYFSRAIHTSKGAKPSSNNDSSQVIGITPIAFYRQRAAAYRKNGDFEKAAQDYVLIQRYAAAADTTAPDDESVLYSAEHLYNPVSQTAKATDEPTKTLEDGNDPEDPNRQEIRGQQEKTEPEVDIDEPEDALTAWTLQRCLEIGRLPPSDRSNSDLVYLADFMQKRFSVCAALHPEVCQELCREMVLSPEAALTARTAIFMEHEEASEKPSRDRSLFFILQGRVSICKTAGRMFQSSPHKQQPQDQEPASEDERYEPEEPGWRSPWESERFVVTTDWRQSQLELCELEQGEIFGHQGKFADATRWERSTATVDILETY